MRNSGFVDEIVSVLSPAPHLEENLRHASVSIILYNSKAPQILMIQRSVHAGDPWSGQMAFPGGKADPEDLSLQSTAERETFEEMGIQLATQAQLLGNLSPIRARRRGKILSFSVLPFVYWLKDQINPHQIINPDSKEVAAFHWIPIEHLLNQSNHTQIDYKTSGSSIQLPAITIGEQKIWGLSYLMLTDFFERLLKTQWLQQRAATENIENWNFWKRYPGDD